MEKLSNDLEIWKDIQGYEGLYQVSNLGRVKSYDREVRCKNEHTRVIKGKILAPTRSGQILNDGSYYLKVSLTDHNKNTKSIAVHRLVALAFCDNPNSYSEVNHIDENKHNNCADNLEWCSRAENNHHSLITETLNESKKKSVLQLSTSGEIIKEFSGVREAARELGLKTHKHIGECCNGKAKTAGGFCWKWK